MKMIRHQLFIFAALLAGVAIGFFVRPSSESAPQPTSEPETPVKPLLEDKGDAAVTAALRQRIKDLEKQLANLGEKSEEILSNAVEKLDIARKQRERRPGGPREMMEEMKKNDPQRYAQMTNHIARWRQNRQARQAERVSFLASVDTSHMSASSRETHETYQELLEKRAELEEKLQNPELTEEDRRSLMDEMFSIERQVRQTSSSERSLLLTEVAHAVGLDGDSAQELVETVNDVVDVTGEGSRGPGGGPGGPGGGPGGGHGGGPQGGPQGGGGMSPSNH